MKILYYIYGLPVGGAETIVVNYLIKLKEKNNDVVLVVKFDWPSYLRDKVVSHNIRFISLYPKTSFSTTGKIKQLIYRETINISEKWKQILTRENPDIIHWHSYSKDIAMLDFPICRMVFSFHSDVERIIAMEGKPTLQIFKTLAEKGLTFTALSQKMKTDIQQQFLTDKILLVGNGVDIEAIRTYREKTAPRKELSIPEESFVLGHVGRFDEVKNHERIISIFCRLHQIVPNSYLVLVGGDYNGGMQKIKNLIRAAALDDYVRILGIRQDTTYLMQSFDAFILPSLSESFSLVLIEAQAQGIRCVASDRVPEDVICNANCFRMSLDSDDKKWAEKLLGNDTNNCVKDIKQYDINTIVDKLVSQYKAMME